MLIKKTDRKKTTLTVVNYCAYQDSENHKKTTKEPQKNHEETTKRPQKDTNNNDNNVNNENNENKSVVVEEKNKKEKIENENFPAADIPNELKNLPCERDLPPIENNTPKAFEFYEENFVKPNGKIQAPQAIANDLIQAIQTMGDDLVLLALQKTLEKDATWRYTKTILDNWKKTGIKTIEQAMNEKKPASKNKNPKNMTMKETMQNINWDELEG
jgi:DnaD/phage-associated family protein